MGLPEDTPLRLRLRVAVKVMAWVALVAGVAVAGAYIGGGPDTRPRPTPKRVALDDLAPGQARTVRWQGRPVIVVRTRDRADRAPWRVAFAYDPVHGCPVRWHAQQRVFLSSCSDARYGPGGRRRPEGAGPALEVPRHRIEAGPVLVLGRGPATP